MPDRSDPLVSVFIPSYNHAQYVEQAVRSVLDQTYENLELIVVDDGSADDSHDVLRQFGSDPRVTLRLNTENRGQSAVFNQAIEISRGEFIAYVPSDDWHLPDKTRLQVQKFLESGPEVGVVYGRGARYFEDTGETRNVELPLRRGKVLRYLLEEGNFVYPATPMFRRECFERVKLDESYRAEGEAIYMKIALHFQFDFVDEVVAVMRDHSYNTGKDVRMMYEDNIRYWNDFFALPDIPDELRDYRSVRIAAVHRTKGLELIRKLDDCPAGRRALLNAVRTRPIHALDWRLHAAFWLSLLPSPLRHRFATARDPSPQQADDQHRARSVPAAGDH